MWNEESIFQHIEKGEITEAVEETGRILEENPDDRESIANYYALRFWQNRESYLFSKNSRFDVFLLEEWNRFEELYRQGGFQTTRVFFALKKFILDRIRSLIDEKLQREGAGDEDISLLLELANQYHHAGEITKAKEILGYLIQFEREEAKVFFFFGDVFFSEYGYNGDRQSYVAGYSYLRDGFLVSPDDFSIYEMHSHFLQNFIQELLLLYDGDEGKVHFWFPVFLMLRALVLDLQKIPPEKIMEIEEEIERLEEELVEISAKYKEKVFSRLIFFYLVILHALLHHYDNEERMQEILERLKELVPGLHGEILSILEKMDTS